MYVTIDLSMYVFSKKQHACTVTVGTAEHLLLAAQCTW